MPTVQKKYQITGYQDFYFKGMGWFSFRYPIFAGFEIYVDRTENGSIISYGESGGSPADYPRGVPAAGVEVCVGPSGLFANATSFHENPNGIKCAKVVKNILHQGVVFETADPVTIALNYNKVGMSFTDLIFQSAIDTFRMTDTEEKKAKDIIWDHMEKFNIFSGQIVTANKLPSCWIVMTNQYSNQTTYMVDVVNGVILSSESKSRP